jgi:DinB family protein
VGDSRPRLSAGRSPVPVKEKNVSDLHSTLSSVLADRYTANAARVRELAAPLTNAQFWQKPFPFGNSFGHLVLHLTGNLNYYVGAQIAKTGYVRDRPREFNDPNPPSKDEALNRFDEAVTMVITTIRAQSPEHWSAEYSGAGANAKNRLDMVTQCAAHIQHHIGQMIYLGKELSNQTQRG